MNPVTPEDLPEHTSFDIGTPALANVDIIDAIQVSGDENPHQMNDTPISQESDIRNINISLSSDLIPPSTTTGPDLALNEVSESILQINETTAAEPETAALESPIDDAILFASVTTKTDKCYDKSSTKTRRKKTWIKTNWVRDYTPREEPVMDVNPLPEFNPPIFDTFCYGGQAVVLDVEVLSNFQLRNNGAFGFVYYGRIPGRLSIEIAAKRMVRSRSITEEINTLELVARGDHPNIVDYYCTLAESGSDYVWICMEYMSASLYEVYRIMHQFQEIDYGKLDCFLRRILHSCTEGLSYLKVKDLIHRDIKPHNILINRECQIKLCDFGIAINSEELKSKNAQPNGTEIYIPPRQAWDIQDDMWSLGLTLLEICDGEHPFTSDRYKSTLARYNYEPRISDRLSPEMQYCILHLLQIDPKLRPKSYDVILMWDCVLHVPAEPLPEEIQFIHNILQWMPSVAPAI